MLNISKYAPSWLDKYTILYAWSGSTSYGTRTEDSDDDFRGVTMLPEQYNLGLDRFDQYKSPEGSGEDIEVRAIKEYVKLALDGNPNVVELLFTYSGHFIYLNKFGKALVDARHEFLSKKFYKKIDGFAKGQKHDLENSGKPNHGQGSVKRLEQRIKYGYDLKAGQNLIRIPYEGIEVMETGTLSTYRPEAQRKLLIDIKLGKYTKEQLLEMYDELKFKLDEAYLKTELPENPDYHKINKFLINLTKWYQEENKDDRYY
jgi:predicted nucleotidyltransferase